MVKTQSDDSDGQRLFGRTERAVEGAKSASRGQRSRASSSDGAERDPAEILRSYFSRLRESVKVEFLKTVDGQLMRKAGYEPIDEQPSGDADSDGSADDGASDADGDAARTRRRAERKLSDAHVLVIINDGEVMFEGIMLDYTRYGARIALRSGDAVPAKMKVLETVTGRSHRARKIWSEDGEVGIEFA